MKTMVNWEQSEFFVDVPSRAIDGVKSLVREETYRAEDLIFDEGDEATDLCILKSGRVELTYNVPTRPGAVARITLIHPGEVFAWSALTGGLKLTAKATAVEDSEAFRIPADSLRKLMDGDPQFGYHVMNRLAQLISSRLLDTRTQLQWLQSF